jgi:hypothetical protein
MATHDRKHYNQKTDTVTLQNEGDIEQRKEPPGFLIREVSQ